MTRYDKTRISDKETSTISHNKPGTAVSLVSSESQHKIVQNLVEWIKNSASELKRALPLSISTIGDFPFATMSTRQKDHTLRNYDSNLKLGQKDS